MSNMVLDGVASRSRSSDPVTSVDAGRSVNLADSQLYVLELLGTWGPMADHELVELDSSFRRVKFSPQRLRSARSELVEAGLVSDTGWTRETPSGRAAKVWQAVVSSE